MAVLKDYKCDKHGYFESFEAKCPMKSCSEDVYVVFLQAPGLISDTTKKNDKNIKQLAMEFDMTDVKSTREGENQAGFFTRKNKTSKRQLEKEAKIAAERPREPRPGDAAIWGGGGGMDMKSALSGRFNRPVGPQLGKETEVVSVMPKSMGNLTGPKMASYTADHENLSLKK
jgi:hypothetical protein